VPDFVANGSRTIFDGWLKADPRAKGDDIELPKVKTNELLTLKSIESEQKQTEPTKRYTEASLIKELEKRGIGRPSTYASIMKTLVDRNYMDRVNKSLHPTELGEVIDDFLEKHFAKYISDSFTSEMENDLDEIAEGKRDYAKTLEEFYTPFSKDVKSKSKIEKITNLGNAPKEIKCPKCGRGMIWKLARGGKFLSCENFPECIGARTAEGEVLEEKKVIDTGEKCAECGKGTLIERESRFGKFLGCSRYPKCKYTKQEEGGENNNTPTTNVKCTECKNGFLTERKGRFGIFYSCSNYPKCRFAIKAKPTGKKCGECGSLMMQGTKTIPDRCSNKECPNHNPHKK